MNTNRSLKRELDKRLAENQALARRLESLEATLGYGYRVSWFEGLGACHRQHPKGDLEKLRSDLRSEISTLRRETAEPPVKVVYDPATDLTSVLLNGEVWADDLGTVGANAVARSLRDKWRKGEV